MIFQLSERERIRIAPRVRVRYAAPRVVKPAPRTASETRNEPVSRNPQASASVSEPAPFSLSLREAEAIGGEKDQPRPFPDCEKYESQGGCQTVLHQRYEGNRGDIMRCNTCGRTFSARRGGISFRSRLAPEMLRQLVDCHRRGDSIRKTSKILDLNRGTVRRYYRLLEEGSSGDLADL